MVDRPPRPTRLAQVRSLLLLALAIVGYLLCGWSVLLLRTVPTAPLACAHEESHPSPTSLQEELFVGVTSALERPVYHGYTIDDFNTAICVVRASDGAILRHYALGENVNIWGLAQAGGVFYYGLEDTSQKGQLCAMRASNGARLWCHSVSGVSTELSLVISNETLYFQTQAQAAPELLAFRTSDGSLLWEHDEWQTFFAVGKSAVYIPTSSTQICALQASDGTPSWCKSVNVQAGIAAVTADGTGIYVLGGDGSVVALRSGDGGLLWQQALQRVAKNIPTDSPPLFVEDGILSITTRDPTNSLREILTALQASDGTTLWQTPSALSLSATAVSGVVYLGSQDTLQALQATSGKPLWQTHLQLESQYPQYRLVSGGEVLYLLGSGNVSAFSRVDGRFLWEHTQCTDSSGSASLTPQSRAGGLIWCTWGTDSSNTGSTWSARNSVGNGFGVPGVLATGA